MILCLENSDWTCIINPETKMDTGDLYMTFKLLKRRYRSTETDDHLRRLDYFNHPFEPSSEIRLVDDLNLAKAVSLESLATQFEPVEDKKGKQNAIERESKKKNKSKNVLDDFAFEPFDFENTSNF